jgi:hypothetical protein
VHAGFMGEELLGRRAEDGSNMSFREAVKMFATKEEVAEMRLSIAQLPTRAEYELRWATWETFQDATSESLKRISDARIPTWMIGLIPSLIAVLVAWFFGTHR